MRSALPYLMTAGVLAAVMAFFRWVAAIARRRGVAGSAVRAALASYEEAYHVTGYETHQEIQAQADRATPLHTPGDPRPRRRTGRP